jgi:hypothetical protein
MSRLVELATKNCGPMAELDCYRSKLPSVVGGTSDTETIRTVSPKALIPYPGDIADQIKDLQDGGKIVFKALG